MKIAIMGAHRTGKTTLAEHLSKSLAHFELIEEPYYQLVYEGHSFPETPSIDDYILQFNLSVEQITSHTGNVIFDRCPIDLLAYIQAQNECDHDDLQSLHREVESVIHDIDLFVFVPIERPDLIGCSDFPELREEVNNLLYDLMGDFDIETVTVQGSLTERSKQVMDKMKKIQ
ncbi:ATP/GTP-binding protein [Longirhabdus pacifica]|uniref:ATP/GTP-binding protein n=1 Tax=Longirhabdus pacifica TaxID=2305227 RepID=UPI0010089650|nr:ATP-binding protein [Longirhabdus pacifica]